MRVSGQTALSQVAQLFMYRMSKIDLSDEFTGDPSLAEPGRAPPPSSALNSRSHDSGALMHTNMRRESHKLQGRCPLFFFFFAQYGCSFSFFFLFFPALFGRRVDTSSACHPRIKRELGVSQVRVDRAFVQAGRETVV